MAVLKSASINRYPASAQRPRNTYGDIVLSRNKNADYPGLVLSGVIEAGGGYSEVSISVGPNDFPKILEVMAQVWCQASEKTSDS